MKKFFILILLILIFSSRAYAVTEDLTTFTEQDPDGDIAVANKSCTVTTMTRDADAALYKDYGASHFVRFTHLLNARWDAEVQTDFKQYIFYGISNTTVGNYADLDAANVGYGLIWYDDTSPPEYFLRLRNFVDNNTDNFTIPSDTLGVLYYLEFARSSTTVSLNIYADAAHTNLLDTLSVTYASTAYQYIAVCAGDDTVTATSNNISYYVENLDLKEVVAALDSYSGRGVGRGIGRGIGR